MLASFPLFLFAKAPVAGRVKTRMQPALTAEQSAELATEMMWQSADKVSTFWPGNFTLSVTPDRSHRLFSQLVEKYNCAVCDQIDGDLGVRMGAVLSSGIAATGGAVVMGCDVPQIPPGVLQQAWSWMQQGYNVIGPATDGGFYLLGLHKFDHALFDQVVWGESEVLNRVLEQAETLGLTFQKLPTLFDVDEIADLMLLVEQEPRYQMFLPDRTTD